MIKILITGGSGFLGSSLINKISNKNYLIYVLIRKKSDVAKIATSKKVFFLYLEDINLEKLFKKIMFDVVLHLATNYESGDKDLQNLIDSNLFLPLKLLNLSKIYKIKSFINADTILQKNLSNYTLSKYQFNEWLILFSSFMHCVNFKMSSVYGPGDNPKKFIPDTIIKLVKSSKKIEFTKGNQKRDFMFISDAVDAVDKIINYSLSKKYGYDNFEIGSGIQLSIKNFIKLLSKLINNKKTKLYFGKITHRNNEQMQTKVRLNKIANLGWKAKVNIIEGLKKTISFYKIKI